MEELISNVVQWGKDRNIIGGATAFMQHKVLQEEVEEILEALEANDEKNVLVEIGDAVVVLTLMAAILGTRLDDCMQLAYDKIKDRKGRMHNGKFVKETDFGKYGI